MTGRPLLFLDVDGPLNPYAAPSESCPDGYTTVPLSRAARTPTTLLGSRSYTRPESVRLRPGDGAALLALGYDLCWASTWMADANRWIGPILGLPTLPFVDFAAVALVQRPEGVHWKTAAIVAHADGRPFAWVDDEHSAADHTHVATAYPAPVLLHHVDPRVGLRAADLLALAAFAAQL